MPAGAGVADTSTQPVRQPQDSTHALLMLLAVHLDALTPEAYRRMVQPWRLADVPVELLQRALPPATRALFERHAELSAAAATAVAAERERGSDSGTRAAVAHLGAFVQAEFLAHQVPPVTAADRQASVTALSVEQIIDIYRTGWHVVSVSEAGDPKSPTTPTTPKTPRTPSFSYTLGLNCTLGHPDLIVTGLDPAMGETILGIVANCIRAGRMFSDGVVASDLVDVVHQVIPKSEEEGSAYDPATLRLAFRHVEPQRYASYGTQTITFYTRLSRVYWSLPADQRSVVVPTWATPLPTSTARQTPAADAHAAGAAAGTPAIPVLQIVWPDQMNRLPWESGFDAAIYAERQPLLFDDPLVAR